MSIKPENHARHVGANGPTQRATALCCDGLSFCSDLLEAAGLLDHNIAHSVTAMDYGLSDSIGLRWGLSSRSDLLEAAGLLDHSVAHSVSAMDYGLSTNEDIRLVIAVLAHEAHSTQV